VTSGLRSSQWFGKRDRDGIIHRSGLLMQGLPRDVAEGRPVIGIANSWSELTPCNSHLRGLAESVKRGVWEAGGLPLEFPTISLGEQMIRPTAMFLRNLMSMDIEETLRANPVDGVVLLSGCDKTGGRYPFISSASWCNQQISLRFNAKFAPDGDKNSPLHQEARPAPRRPAGAPEPLPAGAGAAERTGQRRVTLSAPQPQLARPGPSGLRAPALPTPWPRGRTGPDRG
jgi:Dehydratase family